MLNEEGTKVSLKDIQMVQNLIQRCLELGMTKREVESTLLQQAKIEPVLTQLVWQKLEAENEEFFMAYRLRVMLKDQIVSFNQLLQKQVELMHQIQRNGVASNSTPMSNGSQTYSVHSKLGYQSRKPSGPLIRPHNTLRAINIIPNEGASGNMVLSNNSNTGKEATMIKAQSGYADNYFQEPRDFGEYGSTVINETMFDPILGFLGQLPQDFNFSDLTVDGSKSTESYSRLPFLGTDENIIDSDVRSKYVTNRLDKISEGWTYEGFSSDSIYYLDGALI